MATLFSKFVRPKEPRSKGQTTDRDLDIIEAILRYRFSPASELWRLVGGNEDVTHRRLRRLWELGLINRVAFPFPRPHSEFYYYLDNRAALDLLSECRRIEIHNEMLEEIRNNREKDYAAAALRGQHMQLGFLKHTLLISRMHYCIEMACRKSKGRVDLVAWRQGGPLTGRKVEVPKVKSRREGNDYFWQESDETERLPVEPDAMFSLRFRDRPLDSQFAHFFFEADRGTMTATDMLKKLRAYFHMIKRQQRHKEFFGIHPVRAVLIETPDEARARRLMQLVNHPLVSGPGKRAGLFWFTISSLFADTSSENKFQHLVPSYLERPEISFDPIWALPDQSLHSLGDLENFTV
jgi:DNA-binding HxlR family transcriptional regulator